MNDFRMFNMENEMKMSNQKIKTKRKRRKIYNLMDIWLHDVKIGFNLDINTHVLLPCLLVYTCICSCMKMELYM